MLLEVFIASYLVLHALPNLLQLLFGEVCANVPDRVKTPCFFCKLLDRYLPDYWLGGHIHNVPYVSGNTWRSQFGKITVLIPGQVMNAQFPDHIIRDLYSG